VAAVHSLRTQAGGESFNSAVQFRLIYVVGVAAVRVGARRSLKLIRANFTLDDRAV